MQIRRDITQILALPIVILSIAVVSCSAQRVRTEKVRDGFRCTQGADVLEVDAFASGIVHVAVHPNGVADERTTVLSPTLLPQKAERFRQEPRAHGGHLRTEALSVVFDCPAQSLEIFDPAGHSLLSLSGLFDNAARGAIVVHRASADPLYGMTGTERDQPVTSLERPQGAVVRAGMQGDGGAPFFFTKRFGVLVDSVDGRFTTQGDDVTFDHDSRREVELFVMVGDPMHTMSHLADLTGHPPMPPRWTLGFLNSQWGMDEGELRKLVAHYRASQIPIDGFILDFDWKAWGEDDYGEWRWNSTHGAGNPDPDKFPNGANGTLGKDLLAQGVHLAGILKPRILLYKDGTTDLMEAAAYAEAHHFWLEGGATQMDYKNHRPSKTLDFSIPAERVWFWQHLEPAFDTGMTAWWSDEADAGTLASGKHGLFSSTEFLDMGRALYDGQRSYSNTRVWSINRNFYLGAQRYGYAEWSGDIKSGEQSMALQPMRMLASMNIGEPHWSMDTGGFMGHPTNEEYARWMEFAAFVPVFRVHGKFGEKRQPWVYGPVAEAAAKNAIRLRYSLLPYIYSAERTCYETGIGLTRPLEWVFPDDARALAQTDEWMFGDAFLVAPVLNVQAASRRVYLPAGDWVNYTTGEAFKGKNTVDLPVDLKTLMDIPLFVRAGSIVATEPPMDDTDVMHPTEITLDVFPSRTREARWSMYDDDGISYHYEKNIFFKQTILARYGKDGLAIDLLAPEGTFSTSTQRYLLRVHGVVPAFLRWNGKMVTKSAALTSPDRKPSWSTGKDRFGDVVEIEVSAGKAMHLLLPAAIDSVSNRKPRS